MKVPRDLDGDELIRRLRKFGYERTRQSGSHIRLTRTKEGVAHHITIPLHHPLRIGTLNTILGEIAENLGISKDELLEKIVRS